MKSDTQIAREFAKRKAITNRGLRLQRDNSAKCDNFYAGNIMDYRAELDFPFASRQKLIVQFNLVQPYVNAVNGFMIQNRAKAKYVARIPDAQQQEFYSKNANSISDYIRSNARADQMESQQNRQVLIKGYGALETAMTYGEGYATRDPNGEIIMGDVTDDVGWDPMARGTNLLDARWAFYRKSYDIEDAKKLFDDEDAADFESDNSQQEDGYKYDPYIYPYDRSKYDSGDMQDMFDWNNQTDGTVWVSFYQWYEIETFYRADNPLKQLKNPMAQQVALKQMQAIADEPDQEDSMFRFDPTAPMLVFDADIKAKLEKMFEDLIKCFPYQRKVFYSAVLSGQKVFKSYRSVSQQGFTIKFKTGNWDNSNKIWTGMVNSMADPVKYYNKSLTEIMYLIASNSKGGWFVEEDAMDDIADFEAMANRTDGVVRLLPGGLAKVKEKKTQFSPSGYDGVLQTAQSALPLVTGIDPTFLGNSDNKLETAILQRQRVRQVVSTLASYFDSISCYQEEHARLLLDLMRVYAENNEGGIIRIIGEEGTQQFMQISKDAFANEYDVDIREAPMTPEDKEQQAQILSSMGDKLLAVGNQAGIVFYSAAIDNLPLEAETKKKIRDALQPAQDPRVAQLQQQVQQLTNQVTQAETTGVLARAKLDGARVAQIHTDMHKTAAEIAKTSAEIEQITIENHLAPLAEINKISVAA